MKPDYTSVFRNLRTPRRLPHCSYEPPYRTPAWAAWLGGAAMGFLLALMLFLSI